MTVETVWRGEVREWLKLSRVAGVSAAGARREILSAAKDRTPRPRDYGKQLECPNAERCVSG